MKKIILFLALSLFSTPVFASSGQVEPIFSSQSLAGTSATVVSRTFNVGSVYKMGYWLKGTKAATPEPIAFTMRLEGSPTGSSGTWATMQTVHENYTSAGYTLPGVATAGTISTVPAMKYIRFTLEGRATNATGTTVDAYLFTQEQN